MIRHCFQGPAQQAGQLTGAGLKGRTIFGRPFPEYVTRVRPSNTRGHRRRGCRCTANRKTARLPKRCADGGRAGSKVGTPLGRGMLEVVVELCGRGRSLKTKNWSLRRLRHQGGGSGGGGSSSAGSFGEIEIVCASGSKQCQQADRPYCVWRGRHGGGREVRGRVTQPSAV